MRNLSLRIGRAGAFPLVFFALSFGSCGAAPVVSLGTAGDASASGSAPQSDASVVATPDGSGSRADSASAPPPRATVCAAAGTGSATVQAPVLLLRLADRYQEGLPASPAVADLDGDGKNEIIAAREGVVVVWNADGTPKWRYDTGTTRIWASPVVGHFATAAGKLQVAVAARDKVFLLDESGRPTPGFPVTWADEMRSLAAADLDGDGKLELVAALAQPFPSDMMNAWHGDGSTVAGFPPNRTGTSGCQIDGKCYPAGSFDQNVALGDLDGDGKADIFIGHDEAYASFQKHSGVAFDANPIFPAKKSTGVRFLFDLADVRRGYALDEQVALQGFFTNSAPAIADLDGDGVPEIVVLGSVQNASQTNQTQGVSLWAMHPDATRLAGWESPLHIPEYLAGLWDYAGTNIVAATNQVTVADIDLASAGPEMIFAGFDGRIHAVGANRKPLWSTPYTTDPNVLTGGILVADLSGDGTPEILFATYSTDEGKGALFILDAAGKLLHKVALPHRGAMSVPTIADVNGDGTLEIVVSLKDADDRLQSALVYTVPGSATNCLPWPTGRANLLRNGCVTTAK